MHHLIMVRNERLESENDSEVIVCNFDNKQIVHGAPVFELSQDPYYLGKFIDADNEFWQVIGMVKISVDEAGNINGWNDVLYRYKDSIMELGTDNETVEPWFVGVPKWKDLRFMQLENGILVTPRPQGGEFGGLGRVGKFMTKNLDTLSRDLEIFAAEQNPDSIIRGLFSEGHWGAVNQLLGRFKGTQLVKAVGHDAYRDSTGLRHYVATCFLINLDTSEIASNVVTIATADDYPSIDPKPGHGLGKIIFPAGIVDYGSGPELFTGVADRITGHAPIDMRDIDERLLLVA
jgi:hypothetical protein